MTDLNDEAARRVGLADAIVIPNERAKEAHSAFDYLRLRAHQRSDRGTTGVLMVGPSQTGKSTILHSYRRRLNTPQALEDGRILVLLVTLTANQTRKGLAQDILRAIDAFGYQTVWQKGTENQLLSRVQANIKQHKVELLILDEIQHLVHSDNQKLASSVSDTIKWLLMESVVPVVMSGVEEAWLPFRANLQLQKRCAAPIVMDPLDLAKREDQHLFRSFLVSFMVEVEAQSIIADATGVLTENRVPECIYEASEGVLGQACNLIKDALYLAIRRGSDALSVSDLSEATDRCWVAFDRLRINPFVHGIAPVRPVRRMGR